MVQDSDRPHSSSQPNQTPISIAELKQRAKAGDGDAIAHLLNQALAHKQWKTKVNLEDFCLQISVYATTVPDPKIALVLIDRAVQKLNLPLIRELQVQGQVIDQTEPNWIEVFELGTRSQPIPNTVKSQSIKAESAPKSASDRFQPKSIDQEAKQSLLIGLVLSIVLVNVGFLNTLFHGFIILVHEVGHALTFWLFGYPAIPSVNILYGGGITLALDQSSFVIFLIYGVIAFLIYLCRSYLSLVVLGLIFLGIYSYFLVTDIKQILITFMGHGMEVIAIALCLYLGISGYFCKFSGDRTIYAMLGFYTLWSDLQFSWKLMRSLEFRFFYEDGIGGMMDNDFVILARDYFQTDLSAIAQFFLMLCVAAPVVAFLAFRYEKRWQFGLRQLLQ